MSFITNFEQSNMADWTLVITATDADTGLAIDFTGAEVLFVVRDECNTRRLSAEIGDGITQPVATTLEVKFAKTQMEALCPGTYKVGCVYQLNDETNQLLTGTVAIYDGVARL